MLKIHPVLNAEDVEEFHNFQARLHRHDPNFIQPLKKDVEAVFDPSKNKLLKTGAAERFLCKNDAGETVGKFAVFFNPKYKQEQPTGGLGFFDCINDQDTADFIFNFSKNWLLQHGCEAMDGPINFGERDKFWGLLIEGFHPPLYGMNYNLPYYRKLFENFGFEVYFNQLCYGRSVQGDVSQNFLEMHARISRNPKISARRLTKNKLAKFSEDFTEVYNAAWASHGEGKQLELRTVKKMFESMKPVLNEHISWFVYEGDKPIAMWINLPDLNQWFKFLKGNFGFVEKLKFLGSKYFVKNTKMVGIVFGIIPEWQKKGIDGYMIWEGTKHLRKHTAFTEFEMQWIGDFNPKMMRIAENLETEITRKLATYRYLFNREKAFERHPQL